MDIESTQVLDPQPWESTGEDGKTIKLPPWKDAVERFIECEFEHAKPIPHEWFYAAFGLIMPQHCETVNAAQQSQLRYLANMDGLKSALLEEHNIAIRAIRGVGYEIVPPKDQTSWAMTEARADLRKALRVGSSRLAFVQADALTDEQRKENMDARAKLSFFRRESRKALR